MTNPIAPYTIASIEARIKTTLKKYGSTLLVSTHAGQMVKTVPVLGCQIGGIK
jgi:hypothetical protein